MRFLALLLVVPAIAGCLSTDDTPDSQFPYYQPLDGKVHYEFATDAGLIHFDWAPGTPGKVWNKGSAPMEVTLPETFLLISGADGRSGTILPATPIELLPGDIQFHLAPPSALDVNITVNGESYSMSVGETDYVKPTHTLVDGHNVWELSAHQEANFPHREPGHENYRLSIEYFQQFFEELGYTTEVDPYGTTDLPPEACVPIRGGTICPESVANVVAIKPGTSDKIIFVSGGHFDMVSGTTHAAFDDTSGVVATMELARALAPFEFEHTLMFGLWGGEENGILGSQFWIQSNPDARNRVLSYWNLDVVGMSWPAPIPRPDPIVIAAGPDTPDGTSGEGGGPVADSLLAWADTLQDDWFGFPDEATSPRDGDTYPVFLYEGIASGQVAGYAGVNAQSDHTPFAAAGIPAYFIFNGDTLAGDNPIGIHNERDTLTNMTKYSLYAEDFDLGDPLWPDQADFEAGKEALADSWETVMWFPFYHAVLVDAGVYTPPAPAAQT